MFSLVPIYKLNKSCEHDTSTRPWCITLHQNIFSLNERQTKNTANIDYGVRVFMTSFWVNVSINVSHNGEALYSISVSLYPPIFLFLLTSLQFSICVYQGKGLYRVVCGLAMKSFSILHVQSLKLVIFPCSSSDATPSAKSKEEIKSAQNQK